MNNYADIAPRLIHTSPFVPSVGYRIIAADGVEVITAVEAPDHVDQVVEGTKPVICAGREVHVDGEEPAVGPKGKAVFNLIEKFCLVNPFVSVLLKI